MEDITGDGRRTSQETDGGHHRRQTEDIIMLVDGVRSTRTHNVRTRRHSPEDVRGPSSVSAAGPRPAVARDEASEIHYRTRCCFSVGAERFSVKSPTDWSTDGRLHRNHPRVHSRGQAAQHRPEPRPTDALCAR
ncbi:unnamed protein product [Pleuronectes platessa]|uniref:Uncharacterized protein n=1 Tax=Pleuronectes platessa TaxID=8262 RepID=A0A9N7TMX2_PLEPL|nr:unnamed protein product [Pleuronectes platessa]